MRAFVFTDPSLARHAGRFVWLEIDNENANNATLRKQLNIVALPSLFILDPKDERVALRWIGAASLTQLEHLLDAGERAVRGGGGGIDAALARADSLFGANQNAEAAAAYEDVLHLAPRDWPQRAHVVESALFTLSDVDSSERCAKLALAELAGLRHSASAGNVVTSGLEAAIQLPADHPRRAALFAPLDSAGRVIAADRSVPMSADDRSGLYITLLDARDDAKDSTGHQAVATQWSEFLDGEAARAKTPAERTVFDSHRLSAYLEIHHPERAIPMLQQSEKDFPDDYNPPARLAIAYKEMKLWDDALAASDRAFARVYGPRQFTLWRVRVDILVGKGDQAAARDAVTKAIAAAEAMPEGQRSEATIASFKKRLASFDAPAATR